MILELLCRNGFYKLYLEKYFHFSKKEKNELQVFLLGLKFTDFLYIEFYDSVPLLDIENKVIFHIEKK